MEITAEIIIILAPDQRYTEMVCKVNLVNENHNNCFRNKMVFHNIYKPTSRPFVCIQWQ